jgi:hypothetical protein
MQPKDNPPPPGGKAVRALSWDREKIVAGGKRGLLPLAGQEGRIRLMDEIATLRPPSCFRLGDDTAGALRRVARNTTERNRNDVLKRAPFETTRSSIRPVE